jgi:hypothetical protein
MEGQEHRIKIGCCNNRTQQYELTTDPNEVHLFEVNLGLLVTCGPDVACGKYPEVIVMSKAEESPPPTDGWEFVGPVYDFTGYESIARTESSACDTVVFGEPVPLLLGYDPNDLPPDAQSVMMVYYDEESGLWLPVLSPEDIGDTGIIAGVGEILGFPTHFSLIGIMATSNEEPPPPPPAEPVPPEPVVPPAQFTISGLSINPSFKKVGVGEQFIFVVNKGGNVTVSANIGNIGGQQGTYVAELKLNGETFETRQIDIGPGGSHNASFTVTGLEPGHYLVEIGGLTGEFDTSKWYNGWLIAGIATGIGLLIWLAWYFGYHRKRRA